MTTFMGVPSAAEARGGVTILGVPFDYASGGDKPEPHAAPTSIRAASTRSLRVRIDSDRDPLQELDVRDGGDVRLPPGEPAGSTAATTAAFWTAHAEGLVDTAASVHVGLRGPGLIADSVRLCGELGYRTIGMDAIVDAGVTATLGQLREIVGERPVYLSWDLDVFDPSVAPGVSPSWGGIDAATGFRLLRGLAGLRIVAADVNNMNTPADIAGMTAALAAQLAFELLFSIGLHGDPIGPTED